MTAREKLILIWECCEYVDKYQPGNKMEFWAVITELLKNKTGYYLMYWQQIITHWIKAHIDEFVKEEMGSGTNIKKNDFKVAVKQFAEYMEIVVQDIDDSVKNCQ